MLTVVGLLALCTATGAAAQRAQQPAPSVPAAFPPAGAWSFSDTRFTNGARQRLYTNSIGMSFVEVPEGAFVMGHYQPGCPDPDPKIPQPEADFFMPRSPAPPVAPKPPRIGEDYRYAKPSVAQVEDIGWTAEDYRQCRVLAARDTRPGFLATVPAAFLMSATEVTQAQWHRVMGGNPSYFQGARAPQGSDNYPVDSVSWENAQAFVRALNALEGAANYALPSEAEWEWAARAATEYSGRWTMLDSSVAAFGWFTGDAGLHPHPVAGKTPNGWNLYDMLGNVNEWVSDTYNDDFLPTARVRAGATAHVLKGGSFMADAHSQSVYDHFRGPGSVHDTGFRIIRRMVP